MEVLLSPSNSTMMSIHTAIEDFGFSTTSEVDKKNSNFLELIRANPMMMSIGTAIEDSGFLLV